MPNVYHCVACKWPIAPCDASWLYGGSFRLKPYAWLECVRCGKGQKWRYKPQDVVERLDIAPEGAVKTRSSAPGASG